VDPDEPRYIAIGRAMAASGDWIMPRLWGSPWFEKPPLVYWLTALGATAGLPPDLSGRLPVALLSLLFLVAYFALLYRQFGFRPAAVTTLLLSTSAGWMAYSSLALTDLPMAAFFSLAVLLLMPFVTKGEFPDSEQRWRMAAAGAAIGLAALGKGLVPVVLILPALWFCRRALRQAWIGVAMFLAIAAPWFLAVYRQAGWSFFEEIFLKQHLARLYSPAIEHVQPFYYYLPVLLLALFPWTPLLLLLAPELRRDLARDERRRFLAAIVVFGLIFFSVSLNKLPGYLLPLLPALFAWLGLWFEDRRPSDIPRPIMVACTVLIAVIPFLTLVLPAALSGQHPLHVVFFVRPTLVALALVPVGFALLARRSWLGPMALFSVVVGAFYVKEEALPVLDHDVSVRELYRELEPQISEVCDGGLHRRAQYQFALYLGRPLPLCGTGSFHEMLSQQGNERPTLTELPPAPGSK
jgi:4-amino-4-deoxy-L-arabinose transferase-like glycosyltransferase